MTAEDALIALGAWLEAVRSRLRAGALPFPAECGDTSADGDRDAESFGVPFLAQVSLWRGQRVPRIDSLDRYREEIHRLARGREFEEDLWCCLLAHVPTSLAKALAIDLVERGLCIQLLGHTWQEPEVWWRVADQVPEAVHNLAYERYTRAEHDAFSVEEVLHAFPRWEEICEILLRHAPNPPGKADWLATQAREHHLEDLIDKRSRVAHPLFAAAWRRSASK